jgi:hypothetical protein
MSAPDVAPAVPLAPYVVRVVFTDVIYGSSPQGWEPAIRITTPQFGMTAKSSAP